MVARGYSTGRKGQQYGIAKPKRGICPECSKKGMVRWQPSATGMSRYCQYCMHTEGHATWERIQAEKDAKRAAEAFAATAPDAKRTTGVVEGAADE